MAWFWRWLMLVGLSEVVTVVTSYNVDLRTAVVHGHRTGNPGSYNPIQPGSMFGYSVAQHVDTDRSWLLVGAPKAQTSQPNIKKGGAIYRCPIESSGPCQPVVFDNRPNNIKYVGPGNYQPKEEKSNQWFGATVSSSGPNGSILGCAPRYVYFSERLDKREPVGACYVMPPAGQPVSFYSPCMAEVDFTSEADRFDKQAKAQFGISAVMAPDGRKMGVGAVGSYYWQGQVFSQNLELESDINQTRQGPVSYDYNYMGYSLTVADFTGFGRQDYVAGLPRGNNLTGVMAVYFPNMTQSLNVSGIQFGEYFGASVAVGDFNGDSYDDIAVGAPLYTDNSELYETGRVVVYYQNPTRRLRTKTTLLRGSKVTASRFGFAMASLGDINRDGFDDLVVGEPYGGNEHRGIIYIFNGHTKGIRTKPSQIIPATDLNPGLRTFGFSLSGSLDLDRNGYSDILIGAYESDMAVFMRSRPILKVDMKVTILPEILDLDDRNCQQSDGTPIVCFSIKTCISYGGHSVPSSIVLNVTWQLEADRPISSRAFYMRSPKQTTESATFTLERRPNEECVTSRAYLKPTFRDKLRPITADASYDLIETRRARNDVTPILDLYTPKTVRANGEIKKDCGDDNKCIPDLVISTSSSAESFILGTSDKPLEVLVSIANRGEDAYEAHVDMQLPAGTSYVNVHDVTSPLPVKCTPGVSEDGEEDPSLIICDLGNPLPATAKVKFTLLVSAVNVTGESDSIVFMMYANSTNPELPKTAYNNYDETHISVRAMADIRLTGVSFPERIFLNATWPNEIKKEEDVGKELVHLYELRNLGPSPVRTSSVMVYWPNYLEAGRDLLYLHVSPEVVQGDGRCQVITHPVNPRNITVESAIGEVGDYGPQLSVNLHQILERRQRRQVGDSHIQHPAAASRVSDVDSQLIRKVECSARSTYLCATIQCDLGTILPDDSALIRVRSRVWVRSLLDIAERAVIVTSTADAQVFSFPHNVKADDYDVDTFQIDTYVAVLQTGKDYGQLEIWVIALSISGGFILLLLLILLLWRCGFFKRKKPDDMTKLNPKQTSHHNGYDAVPAEDL